MGNSSSFIIEERQDDTFGSYIRLEAEFVELKITTAMGPRIFHFGRLGGMNHFFTDERSQYVADSAHHNSYGQGPWRLIGGHRLGISPETIPGSIYPDNSAVNWQVMDNGVILQSNTETWTSLQKEMEVRFTESPGEVVVTHTVHNRSDKSVVLSIWPITAMAGGGVAIVPQSENGSELAPNRSIAVWPYGSIMDPRVEWGDRYIKVQQAKGNRWKFGCYNPKGWMAYRNQNEVFVKRFSVDPDADYPDRGSTCEVFTNESFLELETLSPLQTINPDCKLSFQETWQLLKV